MCGIAGYSSDRGIDRVDRILAMVRILSRRGPDDEGLALFDPPSGQTAILATAETARGVEEVALGSSTTYARQAGPGYQFEHRIALGHRRFSIIDPTPAGHQPFWSHDG